MGFCSGTDIFDPVVETVLDTTLSDEDKFIVIYALADSLENHDWDCQQDSYFYDHPVVQRVMQALHPDWFEAE
jgi:hypothetical protein